MEAPRTGTKHERRFQVGPSRTVTFEGLPPVLSTPGLIWELETAAMELLRPYLGADEISVGTHVDVAHRGPALTGDEVVCVASVVQCQGAEITFRVEALCDGQTIGNGLHKRRVVAVEALRRKLQR